MQPPSQAIDPGHRVLVLVILAGKCLQRVMGGSRLTIGGPRIGGSEYTNQLNTPTS